MVRIAGIDLNLAKRVDISLTKIYGIGRSNAQKILKSADVSDSKRTKDLTEEEISRIQKIVDGIRVEGDLRREVGDNIKRLIEIGSYRGMRHSRNLPSRGQRTRSNARTKRGKRVTIGAIKKEMATKMGITTPTENTEKEKTK